MSTKNKIRHPLSRHWSQPLSYVLTEEAILVRLIGVLPIRKIRLTHISYLRLASLSESSPGFLGWNWISFRPSIRSRRPLYLIRLNSGRRIFLSMGSKAHFTLRKALGEKNAQRP